MLNQEGAIQKLRKLSAVPEDGMAQACSGTYYSKEVDGSFTVTWEDGALWLDHYGQVRKQLHLLEGETYAYGSMGNKKHIEFLRDETGAVTGFIHKTVQTQRMPFQKVK